MVHKSSAMHWSIEKTLDFRMATAIVSHRMYRITFMALLFLTTFYLYDMR